jgi:peptidoglycan/LPS O-acetylase OafA/YrhL
VTLPTSDQYFHHLDSLRGVAALMVVLLHVSWTNHFTQNAFIQYGAIFVDFFFVLSGVVISHVYPNINTKRDFQVFLKRRFARLYPLHIITLFSVAAGFVILYLFAPAIWQQAQKLPEMDNLGIKFVLNLLFLNAHSLTNNNSFNGPSWSIGAEVTCYLIYGIILVLFFEKKKLIYYLLVIASFTWFMFNDRSIVTYQYNWGFIRGVYGFFIGCLVYSLRFESDFIPTKNIFIVSIFAVATLLLIGLHDYLGGRYSFVFPILFGILLYLLLTPDPRISRFLSIAPLRFLGMLSYSIYMLHFLVKWGISIVISLFFKVSVADSVLAVPIWIGDLLVVLYLLILFSISWLSYRFYEEPLRRWLR